MCICIIWQNNLKHESRRLICILSEGIASTNEQKSPLPSAPPRKRRKTPPQMLKMNGRQVTKCKRLGKLNLDHHEFALLVPLVVGSPIVLVVARGRECEWWWQQPNKNQTKLRSTQYVVLFSHSTQLDGRFWCICSKKTSIKFILRQCRTGDVSGGDGEGITLTAVFHQLKYGEYESKAS